MLPLKQRRQAQQGFAQARGEGRRGGPRRSKGIRTRIKTRCFPGSVHEVSAKDMAKNGFNELMWRPRSLCAGMQSADASEHHVEPNFHRIPAYRSTHKHVAPPPSPEGLQHARTIDWAEQARHGAGFCKPQVRNPKPQRQLCTNALPPLCVLACVV